MNGIHLPDTYIDKEVLKKYLEETYNLTLVKMVEQNTKSQKRIKYLEELLDKKDATITITKKPHGEIVYVNGQTAFNFEDKGMTENEVRKKAMERAYNAAKMAKGGEAEFSTIVREVLSKHGITQNEIFKIYVDKPSKKNPNRRSVKVKLIGFKFNDNTDLAKKIGDDLIKLGAIKETIWINNQEISFIVNDFKSSAKMATGGEVGKRILSTLNQEYTFKQLFEK